MWELVLMAGDGGWKIVLVSAHIESCPLSSKDRRTAMLNFSSSLFTALLKDGYSWLKRLVTSPSEEL